MTAIEFQTRSLPRAAFCELSAKTSCAIRFDETGNAIFVFSAEAKVVDAAKSYDVGGLVGAREFSHAVAVLRDRLFAAKSGNSKNESIRHDRRPGST